MTNLPFTTHINRAGLARYVVAAMLARIADGGGVLAVILLCTSDNRYSGVTGILAACITLPHMLGPFIARKIDTANDGRKIIATACILYALLTIVVTLTFSRVPLLLTALLLIAAGLCGPLLTGGISTFLPSIAGSERKNQRRAQGWDVATYGFGGTLGPSAVAAVSAWYSPSAAFVLLATGTVLAAFFVMRLPFRPSLHHGDPRKVPGALSTIRMMSDDSRLRQTLGFTMAVAFAVAALPVVAVSMAPELGVPAATAALFTVAYGGGNLAGSFCLMAFPLKGTPDRLMIKFSVLIMVFFCFIISGSSFTVILLCFFITGMLNSGFFAATLAARSEYSPASCRGQVFVWVGALKITAGSLGTATAGQMMLYGTKVPVVTGLTVMAAVAALFVAEKVWLSANNNGSGDDGT